MDQTSLNLHYKKVADVYEKGRIIVAGSPFNSVFFILKMTHFLAAYTSGQTSLHSVGAKALIDMMHIKKDDRVVDLGAGTCDTAGSETGRLLSSYNVIARLHYLHGAAGAASDLCGSCQGNVGYCHQE